MKWFGYTGKLLYINLTTCNYQVKELELEQAVKYLGGKGLAASILYEKLKPGTDPLGPDNILVFATGPLTGTPAPTAGRMVVATKSPLTGLWLDSNCGGFLGREIKQAGYDALIVEGKAAEPVYILIDDDKVEICSAANLVGKDTFDTHEILRESHGEVRVACIGQSGERMDRLAAIISEARAFGRGGAGAVMGSKNLKAIAVRGTNSVKIADYDKFVNMVKEAFNEVAINPDTGGGRNHYGTNVIYSFINEAGIHPVENFTKGKFGKLDVINEEILRTKYYKKDKACSSCPIACSKYSVVEEGKYQGKFVEGPEYENLWSFGAQCGNSDIGAIIHAEYLCDAYGLDSVSVGNAIGFAMECYKRGVLTEEEIGYPLQFGDTEAMMRTLEAIGKGEGIGKLLAQGVKYAAEQIGKGSEKWAMHVKGMELPAYDPRGAYGMGLAYATSDRGGCHLRSWPVAQEVLSANRMDPFSVEFKAEFVKSEQDLISAVDSVGLCLFASFAMTLKQMVGMLSALTGIKELDSGEELLKIGERIYNLTRLFNMREGMNASADNLPERLLTETHKEGPAAGSTVPLEEMIEEYYRIRHWDENGKPMQSKLKDLGL
ncbi:aldehyde ferredoxin oxidoreductase family protein [Desulfofalx alkaliphila]|uniref:aldehyde ferredoxin oxidoreductase family protein n=1 Tax=Desulfofalx alkaliphila TaxID=105483 RepID=UPI0004E19A0B|nr:aldehyde ferredoxin oxidoreductase family protein [Desulfofalx alkaliphila]